jgi:nitrite reductase (NO-forming)
MSNSLRRSGRWLLALIVILSLSLLLSGCARIASARSANVRQIKAGQPPVSGTPTAEAAHEMLAMSATAGAEAGSSAPGVQTGNPVSLVPDVSFTLRTEVGKAGLTFVGVGGAIDGQINPKLEVAQDAVVQVTLVNGDGALHDVVFPDFNAGTERITGIGASSTTVFRASQEGEFAYFCSLPGHRQAGMEGQLVVGAGAAAVEDTGADIVRDPADLPAPVGNRGPQMVEVNLETVEIKGQLADGTTYNYWTFNGKVPGPMVRVRVGDTVHVILKNNAGSQMIHSVDFHAVTGPGGGATVTQVPPGQQKEFTFKALNPGLYVYHCATPMVSMHISNGMYGLILVEPEGGLPPADREFYVMQGELYTQQAYGMHGSQEFSVDKLLDEKAEYVTFNGAVGALSQEHPLKANVGQTVRIFFGDGGPNYTSSFHVIGEIFDKVYNEGSLTTPPLTDVQTTLVPAGGSAMVEFKLNVPGRYVLVDHSLARLERGLVGFLYAEGPEAPDIFSSPEEPSTSSGH